MSLRMGLSGKLVGVRQGSWVPSPGRGRLPLPQSGLHPGGASRLLTMSFVVVVFGPGCAGLSGPGEQARQQQQSAVSEIFRPAGVQPALPDLAADSPLSDFLIFAMLNQPKVEAAYFDWIAAVQRITVARSFPDPRLTFSTDIRDMVMALMPGLTMNLPGPGKLGLQAEAASAEADRYYYQFVVRVLQAAFEVRREYYSLYFLTERLRINREMLVLVGELESLARTQYTVDKVTYQDVLRAQIEQDRLVTAIENLEDQRQPLVARWQAALGIHPDQATPPVPATFESTPQDVNPDELYAAALEQNPQLKAMAAEVRQAEAAWRLALRSQIPDFSLGLSIDLKSGPLMWRPQASMSLPVWRDKIAAEIAAAQSRKDSAQARLTGEQIHLAVMFSEGLFSLRESLRNLELLQIRLLPKARESLHVARTAYLSGRLDFFNLLDAEQTLLEFRLAEVEALTRKEIITAELSLIIRGTLPESAPVFSPASERDARTKQDASAKSRGPAS